MESKEDATALFNSVVSGINADTASLIAGTLAKRFINVGFSFGSASTTTTASKTHQLPNRISAELIHLDCPTEVHLQGHHVAKDFIVKTESFTSSDMIDTVKVEIHTKGSSVGFNLMTAVVGAAIPAMNVTVGSALLEATSLSHTDISQSTRQVAHTPTPIIFNEILRVNLNRFFIILKFEGK